MNVGDRPWYDLSSKNAGGPTVLRRKAGYLANHLDRLVEKASTRRWNRALESAFCLQKAIRFCLARANPKSPDGKLLRKRHPKTFRRERSDRTLVVRLCKSLTPAVEEALQVLGEVASITDIDTKLCMKVAEELREGVDTAEKIKALSYAEETEILTLIAKKMGTDVWKIRKRVELGWSLAKILSTPLTKGR